MARARTGRMGWRARIVADVRRRMHERWRRPKPPCPIDQACLYWSLMTIVRLREAGVRAIPQAGTACWPRLSPAQHAVAGESEREVASFGYVWTPGELTSIRVFLSGEGMPEMHVWVGIVESQEIVDLTTGFQPACCRKLTGLDWPGPKPPDHLWTSGGRLPQGFRYEPVEAACMLADRMMRTALERGDLAL